MSSTRWEGIFTTIRNLFHTFMFYILKSAYLYRSQGFFFTNYFFTLAYHWRLLPPVSVKINTDRIKNLRVACQFWKFLPIGDISDFVHLWFCEKLAISSFFTFCESLIAWREWWNVRWEKWLARQFMKCHLYTSRFSHFANIFSCFRQFADKCIARLRVVCFA